MFSAELEKLIEITLSDGVLTDQEKSVLIKQANAEGVDIDQLDVYIQYLMQQRKEEEIKKAEAKKASETIGNIRKCPMCGAVYVQGSLVCECGYIFDITVQSKAYEEFHKEVQKKLSNVSTGVMAIVNGSHEKDRLVVQTFISNYPVPNTRIDLLEFLINLQVLADPRGPKTLTNEGDLDFSYYYWKLYTNCINKAKLYFAADKDFQSSFEFYEEKMNEKPSGLQVIAEKATQPAGEGELSLLLKVLCFLVPIVGLVLWIMWKSESPEKAKNAAKMAIYGFIFSLIFPLLF